MDADVSTYTIIPSNRAIMIIDFSEENIVHHVHNLGEKPSQNAHFYVFLLKHYYHSELFYSYVMLKMDS